MRYWYFLAVLAAAPGCAQTPSNSETVDDMLNRLRVAMPGRVLTLAPDDPMKILVQGKNDNENYSVYLDRVVNYCHRASRNDCESMKVDFVQKSVFEPSKIDVSSLRFIVRNKQYVDWVDQSAQGKETGVQVYRRQIGDDLYMLLASDSKDHTSLVGTGALKEIGLNEDEAWNRAIDQTRKLLPPLPDGSALKSEPAAYQGEEYFGSLLGDLEGWSRVSASAGPDLIVTAVSDQFVFAGLLPNGSKLNDFAKSVREDCAEAERCISPHVYRFHSGRWVIAQ